MSVFHPASMSIGGGQQSVGPSCTGPLLQALLQPLYCFLVARSREVSHSHAYVRVEVDRVERTDPETVLKMVKSQLGLIPVDMNPAVSLPRPG